MYHAYDKEKRMESSGNSIAFGGNDVYDSICS